MVGVYVFIAVGACSCSCVLVRRGVGLMGGGGRATHTRPFLGLAKRRGQAAYLSYGWMVRCVAEWRGEHSPSLLSSLRCL